MIILGIFLFCSLNLSQASSSSTLERLERAEPQERQFNPSETQTFTSFSFDMQNSAIDDVMINNTTRSSDQGQPQEHEQIRLIDVIRDFILESDRFLSPNAKFQLIIISLHTGVFNLLASMSYRGEVPKKILTSYLLSAGLFLFELTNRVNLEQLKQDYAIFWHMAI